jgi:acetyl esterase/lipase
MTEEHIRLWPGTAPGSESWTQQEALFDSGGGDTVIRNVVVPTLTAFVPDPAVANGTAVIIAPGGGFFMLSWLSEGTRAAEWLCERGVTCFLLKYRLTDTGASDDDFRAFAAGVMAHLDHAAHEAAGNAGTPVRISISSRMEAAMRAGAAADAIRAVEIVRERADEWHIRTDRIGLMGFSAGGFLATHVALEGPPSARLDFVVTIYGGHAPIPVPADAPPLFSVVAADDALCFSGCMEAFHAWQAAGRPAELHVYAQGGHGFGMARRGLPIDTWIERLADWMSAQDLLLASTVSLG